MRLWSTFGERSSLLMRSKRDANRKVVRMALRPDGKKLEVAKIDFRATKKAARGSLFLVIGRAGSNWTLIGPARALSKSPKSLIQIGCGGWI